MTYKVHISDQAADDLRAIYGYIAFELQALENAEGQLSRLEKGIYSLNEMPERYRRYPAEPWWLRDSDHAGRQLLCFLSARQ